jgi:membrane protein YqaA with SNARE-associated domain
MPQLEIYLLLFTDTLVSNFAFNNSTELAIFSMKVFGFYNPYIVIATASSAVTIAYCANYLLGIACYKILAPMNNDESGADNSKRIEVIRTTKFLPLIILLSGVPFFGKFVILFAGFCRVRFLMTIALGTLAKFIYYIVTYLIL